MLRMGQEELAEKAGTTRRTVALFEHEERQPRAATLEKFRQVLEAEGAAFIESDSGVGVMMMRKPVV
jgi:transcriptional regulator with XRE-family HTH domain